MLIVFPLGLLAMSVVFDVIGVVSKASVWGIVSYWNIAAGIVMGLVAAAFGIVDLLAIPSGTRAARVGLAHALLNVVTIGLFCISFVIRTLRHTAAPDATALVLSIAGLAVAIVSGWLGGELVDQLGVGVNTEAIDLNAPSSLRRRRSIPR